MMKGYDLTVTTDYSPDWSVVGAVRELFQNALDQQTKDEANTMAIIYDEEAEKLLISNKHSVLEPKSLLFGSSTKADDTETIGKFGEGYKLATLILLRESCPIVFYNYGRNEVWRPRFKKSRVYDAQLLRFEVDKAGSRFRGHPSDDLVIEVSNITADMYADIVESNLHLQEDLETNDTDRGSILLDDKFKGKVFVGGLYVNDVKGLHYGYDIKPKYIDLGRDRRMASDFNVTWESSKMWSRLDDPRVLELVHADALDVQYLSHFGSTVEVKLAEEFRTKHGANAVPISTEEDRLQVLAEYSEAKPVIVPAAEQRLIRSASSFSVVAVPREETPRDRYEKWFSEIESLLTELDKSELLLQGAELTELVLAALENNY